MEWILIKTSHYKTWSERDRGNVIGKEKSWKLNKILGILLRDNTPIII